jgi:hypothetical protein
MSDPLVKIVAVLFTATASFFYKAGYFLVSLILRNQATPAPLPPAAQRNESPPVVKTQQAPPVVTVTAGRPLSPLGKRIISERPAGDPEVLFAYATARRSGLVGRDNHVGKAQLLALPARMAVPWRRFSRIAVDDPKFRVHAVGRRNSLAVDESDMTPELYERYYQEDVVTFRPDPSHTPGKEWVDYPQAVFPEAVIHTYLARQFRLELPTWKALPTPIRPEAPVVLPPDNQYWAISLRARTRFNPPAGMLLGSRSTVAE